MSTPNSIPVYRVQLVRERRQVLPAEPIKSPEAAAKLFRDYMGDVDREMFVMLGLSTTLRPIGLNTISIGTLEASLVHPREVFKPAILMNAASILLAHNHPSGDCEPNLDDEEVTHRLVQIGEIIDVPVLDHLIIGDERHTSLFERELLKPPAPPPPEKTGTVLERYNQWLREENTRKSAEIIYGGWKRGLEPEPDDTLIRLETKRNIASSLVLLGGGKIAEQGLRRIECALRSRAIKTA